MKLSVEFDSKAEMDAFFQASESGGIERPEVALVNKLGQSIQLKPVPTTKPDGSSGTLLMIELHQRGTHVDDGITLAPETPFVVA